jgi:hypothetical protein
MKTIIGIGLMLAGILIGLYYTSLAPASILMKDGWGVGIWGMAAGIFLCGFITITIDLKGM